ncbi:MAG: hypothetical protein JW844_00320 [Candidatus Omnitrophica bacterium]|nr:hypothetical protein [Candidatus Omnitrophota bacterium]
MKNRFSHQTRLIIVSKLRAFVNSLRLLSRENADFRVVVIGGCFGFILLLVFLVSFRGLYYVKMFPGIGPLLVDRVLFLLFFAIFVMLISSNIIVGYTTLFRSEEVETLLPLPMRLDTLFCYKFFEALILSSWAPLFLCTPILIAFGLVRKAHPFFYLMGIIATIPLLVIAAILGILLLFLFVRFFPVKKVRIGILPFFIIVGVALTLFLRTPTPTRITSQEVPFLMNEILRHTSFASFPLLPHYWASRCLVNAADGRLGPALFYFLVLLSNALMFIQVMMYIVYRSYYSYWVMLQGERGVRRIAHRSLVWRIWGFLLGFLRPSVKALVLKDAKVFRRDPAQWSQVVIFFGILAIYILNLRTLPYNLDSFLWKHMVAFLNLTATALTMAMLNIRFVFPLLSLEGRRFWILGLSPMGPEKLLMEKFWVSAFASFFITETLVITSNIMLRISGIMLFLSAFTICMMSFAIAGLSVGLGAIYPDFKSDNPAQIVSGFGGTLLLVISLIYVMTVISLEASPIYWYINGHITGQHMLKVSMMYCVAVMSAVSFATCVVPMKIGLNALKKIEL